MLKKFFINKTTIIAIIILMVYLAILIPNLTFRFVEVTFLIILVTMFYVWEINNNKYKSLSLQYKQQSYLLKTIFAYNPDPIYIKDKNLNFIACNNAFLETLLLNSEEDVLNKKCSEFISKESAIKIDENDKKVLKDGKNYAFDQIIERNDKQLIFEVLKAPLVNETGEIYGILAIARDVTEHRTLQKQMEKKQLEMNLILDNMPFIAYLKDLNGNIIYSNKLCDEIIYKKDLDSEPTNLMEFYFNVKTEDFNTTDAYVIEKKEPLTINLSIDTTEGTKWLEVHKIPIINDHNEVENIVVLGKDITLNKEIENQKETFIATLTHDLKTPTIAQIKALEILLKKKQFNTTEEDSEMLSEILNSCKYMLNIVSNMIKTYKYEAGNVKLTFESFNLPELIKESCDELKYLAREKHQTFSHKFRLQNEFINADKLEIKRVIFNLIANAIYYSYDNSEIKLALGETEDKVIFLVTNKSKYLPEEELNNFFNKYVSSADRFKQIGTGLGLYISKQIITAHHGNIIAKSDKEIGNTFGFELFKENFQEFPEQEEHF